MAVAGRTGIVDSHCLEEAAAVVEVEVEEAVGMRGNPRIVVGGVEEVDGGAGQGERSRRFVRRAIQVVFGRCRGERSDLDAGVVVVGRSQGAIAIAELAQAGWWECRGSSHRDVHSDLVAEEHIQGVR